MLFQGVRPIRGGGGGEDCNEMRVFRDQVRECSSVFRPVPGFTRHPGLSVRTVTFLCGLLFSRLIVFFS